ncbi:MAG: DNA-binding protein WhiA [Finegoldia magna]|nr:DNA-binding protein WhiA [Finegoldia magna]
MSFSSDIKTEIISNLDDYDVLAMLSAFTKTIGTLNYNSFGVKITLKTESNPVARLIFSNLKKFYNYECDMKVIHNNNLRKKNIYEILIDDKISKQFCEDTHTSTSPFDFDLGIDEEIIDSDVKKISFLQGAFLGTGFCYDPSKMYHLEMIFKQENVGMQAKDMLYGFGIKSSIFERNENYVLYIKEAEAISDFLSLTKAYNSVLKLENVRVLKDIKNNVNRRFNFETANLNKTVDAALKQKLIIEKIEKTIGLESLDPLLLELAYARIENPDVSLKELGEMMTPKISKSGVSYRLNKLKKIADDL